MNVEISKIKTPLLSAFLFCRRLLSHLRVRYDVSDAVKVEAPRPLRGVALEWSHRTPHPHVRHRQEGKHLGPELPTEEGTG